MITNPQITTKWYPDGVITNPQNNPQLIRKFKKRYSDMEGTCFISNIEVSGAWKVVAIHYYPGSNIF